MASERKRMFLARTIALLLVAIAVAPAMGNQAQNSQDHEMLNLKSGPHLFVDDFLIAGSSNVVRRVVTLSRTSLSETPLLTSERHQTFQPFFTVMRDASSGLFRLWYGVPSEDRSHVRSRIAYTESVDGIVWTNGSRILDVGPIQFGTSVIDEGAKSTNPLQRYKLGWHIDNGLRIATSADGIQWKHLVDRVVLSHSHDINGIFFDAIRARYTAMVSFYIPGETWSGKRRITKQAVSTNLLDWSEPWPVLTPDSRDEGETQFYAMDGFLQRGELLLGMVKVLRDDLKADDPPRPPDAYGIGYTTVAWTRDGKEWKRERTPFLDRNPQQGAWDHAHAWIDEQVPVGDEVYLYYAGYKSGHKVNRFEERQIGLITMKRDRYIARRSFGAGVLTTRPLRISGRDLFVNADAAGGEVRVRVLTTAGEPIKGLSFADCKPVQEDSLKSAVKWKTPLASVSGQAVVLEFSLRDASLFGFEIE